MGSGYLEQAQGKFATIGFGPRMREALAQAAAARCDAVAAGAGDSSSAENAPRIPFTFAIKKRAAKSAAGRTRRVAKAVDLLREEAVAAGTGPGAGVSHEDDAELYDRLRALRTRIASERQWAPYMVLPDKTLRAFCRLRPRDRESLLAVPGIGEKKADDFGDLFLQEIADFEARGAGR